MSGSMVFLPFVKKPYLLGEKRTNRINLLRYLHSRQRTL